MLQEVGELWWREITMAFNKTSRFFFSFRFLFHSQPLPHRTRSPTTLWNVSQNRFFYVWCAIECKLSNDLSPAVCLINSLPFVGFGFLDNFTMIIAGDYIEHSLGMIMTISTMAAAALGNTISDVLGIGSAVYVERFVEIIGIRPPDLTPVQLEMKSSRRASNFVRLPSWLIWSNNDFLITGPRVGHHRRMSSRHATAHVHERKGEGKRW